MHTTSWLLSSSRLLALALWGMVSFQACGGDSEPQNATPACGPGTALVNGQCVVATECGEGTVIKAGKCVPEAVAGQGGAAGSQSGSGGSSAGQGGAQTGGNDTQGGQGGSGTAGAGAGGTEAGAGSGGAGAPTAGSAGGGQAGTGGSNSGGTEQGGTSGSGGFSGDAGSSGGDAGQGGASGSTGGTSTGGTNQAGASGESGAAGSQAGSAGQGGSNPDDVDDPCPSEPIDFNCDPACGDVHPGCATIGCDGKFDFGPTYKTKFIIRTPPNPTPDPACIEACGKTGFGKPSTLLMVSLPQFTGLDVWYEKFSNVTGGWVITNSSNFEYEKCMQTIYSGHECFVKKHFASNGKFRIIFGNSTNLRARNITIERSKDPNVPPTCP